LKLKKSGVCVHPEFLGNVTTQTGQNMLTGSDFPQLACICPDLKCGK